MSSPEQTVREFSPADQQLLKKILSRPLLLPPEFKSWLYKFASGDAAPHFQEILGVRQRRWRIADQCVLPELCSSTSYVDLATLGPQLTGLENGSYMVMFGYWTEGGTAVTRFASSFYNGLGTGGSQEAEVNRDGQAMQVHLVDLQKDNNNSILVRYRTSGGTGNFGKRWLHAVQVAS